MSKEFDVPVVLFTFKRKQTLLKIIDVLAEVKPSVLYLMSDAGRDEEEKAIVNDVRESAENAITWECNVIRDYASINRGVYQNIGLGAKRVFEKEERAIFLEDDNLPNPTFFPYCRELLIRYKDEPSILWICGTNYLGKYNPPDESSYLFTRHQLPCGWASWADKFLKYYDGDLDYFDDAHKEIFKSTYRSKALYKQQLRSITNEYSRKLRGERFVSWDSQMNFSVRSNELWGISPKYNLIRNIGADDFSTHGGSSLEMVMTKRFCEIPTYDLHFPLLHPEDVKECSEFERKTGDIILLPLRLRLKGWANRAIKKALKIEESKSLSGELAKKLKSSHLLRGKDEVS